MISLWWCNKCISYTVIFVLQSLVQYANDAQACVHQWKVCAWGYFGIVKTHKAQLSVLRPFWKINWSCTVRAPVFGRHQFFGTSEHYGKAHGSLLSGWMNYNYTACCWFPTSSNILILPSQFWQIGFESCWLHCSKCQILVLLRYAFLSRKYAPHKYT